VKMDILREAHRTPYMVHLGETKMYQDMRQFLVEAYEGGYC
jgi:hypothetical protein